MNRRQFLTGISTAALAAAMPAPRKLVLVCWGQSNGSWGETDTTYSTAEGIRQATQIYYSHVADLIEQVACG